VNRLEATERGTLLTCPDCWGVLSMRTEGDAGHVYFRCQIGHGFSIESVVAAKKQQLEDRLWSATLTIHEVIRMLEEFETQLRPLVTDRNVIAERRARAQRDIEILRRLTESNEPIAFAAGRERARRGERRP